MHTTLVRSVCAAVLAAGAGLAASPYARCTAFTMPRSPTGSTSGRRRRNIKNISAVHLPIPFTLVIVSVHFIPIPIPAHRHPYGDFVNLAVVGDNRPRLYWAMAAAQCLGGVAVPLYQDAPAADMAYVLENAEIDFAIVEDQEQVDKLLEIRESVQGLTHIVYDDGRGLRKIGRAHV